MGSLKTSGSKKGVMMSKHAVTTPGFSESLLKFLIVMGFGGVEAVVATNEQPNVEATQKDDVPVVIVTRALKVNYRAAKGGVIAFTEGAAKEYSESGYKMSANVGDIDVLYHRVSTTLKLSAQRAGLETSFKYTKRKIAVVENREHKQAMIVNFAPVDIIYPFAHPYQL
ncbi:hypothetical protein Tco_1065142 [Tanacetum coccineum]